jgi:hypothetical protein
MDTNVILCFVDPKDAEYALIREAVEALTAHLVKTYVLHRRIWSSFGMFARALYPNMVSG